jgi:hypothetical protein
MINQISLRINATANKIKNMKTIKLTIISLTLLNLSQKLQAQKVSLNTQLFMNNVSPRLFYKENDLKAECYKGSKRGFEFSVSAELVKNNHFGIAYGHASNSFLIEKFSHNANRTNYFVENFSADYKTNTIALNYRYDVVFNNAEADKVKFKFVPTFDLGLSIVSDVNYKATYYDKSKVTSSSLNINSGSIFLDLLVGLASTSTYKPYQSTSGKGFSDVSATSHLGFAFEMETRPARFFFGYKYGLNKQVMNHWKDNNAILSDLSVKTSNTMWYFGLGFTIHNSVTQKPIAEGL